MKDVLELFFSTGEGRRLRVAIEDPREDLTPAEVEAAMDIMAAGNVFAVAGGIVGIESAQIVTTSTQPFEF
ncbi:MAG TPA: DUF2922 domain-containing protein [Bacillota bacterium]|nr:DUF2922 domain-containing protein [Bacillota bacterium]